MNFPTTTTKVKQIWVRVTEAEFKLISDFEKKYRIPRSEVVRTLIQEGLKHLS